jgi:hypothetical protein
MEDVIENLESAEALLQCLAVALEHSDGNPAKCPDYGLVVKTASSLVNVSLKKLKD